MRVDYPDTTPNEEHLLERLTILENTLARLAERLEQGLKLLLRQSETAYANHALVKSLIEILNECGMVDNNRLEKMWRSECDKLHNDDPEPRKAKSSAKRARSGISRRQGAHSVRARMISAGAALSGPKRTGEPC